MPWRTRCGRSWAPSRGTSRAARVVAGCCWTTSRWSCTCSTRRRGSTTCSTGCGATRGAWILVWTTLSEGLAHAMREEGLYTPERIARLELAIPRDASHGDWTTNLAMTLAKEARTAPRALAERLAKAFPRGDVLQSPEVAGPGFLNFRYPDAFLDDLPSRIVS